MSTLVVARWREDIAWTERVPWRVRIVQKDADLPNLGREPASFLWAILDTYDALDDRYAFVQGNPFDHCPNLLDALSEPITGYRPLGTWHPISDANGGPHHNGLSVGPTYEAWFGEPFPESVQFTAGGQFAVTGDDIRRRPREFYQRLYDDVMRDPALPWVLERLWPRVFA